MTTNIIHEHLKFPARDSQIYPFFDRVMLGHFFTHSTSTFLHTYDTTSV